MLKRGGETDVSSIEITLKNGFNVPYMTSYRRYSPRMIVIEPCEDAAVQGVVMVRKDGAPNSFRMTLDAQAVNAGIVVEPCNPPPIKEMLHALVAKSYYACMYLLSAYWQSPSRPEYSTSQHSAWVSRCIGIELRGWAALEPAMTCSEPSARSSEFTSAKESGSISTTLSSPQAPRKSLCGYFLEL